MLHDKIRTSNDFNNIDTDQITSDNAMCFVGYNNDISGRISLKINDGSVIRSLNQNAKVTDINLAGITNLDYQKGDVFYVDSVNAGDYIITVANLGGSQLKGKNILLYLNNVPANTTISFGGSEIINSPGSWCATFCNLLGTEVITCMSVWKTPGATIGDEEEPVEPINNTPLTFTAISATNSIALGSVGTPDAITLDYNKNNTGWTAYTIGDVIDLASGDTIAFSGNNDHFSKDVNQRLTKSNCYYFTMVGNFEASGNIMSLMNWSNSCTDACFNHLFQDCWLITPPSLPATTLAPSCYYAMFKYTNLTSLPALPATTLADSCYLYMFGSTNITQIPENYLPATTLAEECYGDMFDGCTSLTSVPINLLPATTLCDWCYSYMFYECISLSTAPALPATGLAPEGCYEGMFQSCTALTAAPALPATELYSECYGWMFESCTSLTTPPPSIGTTMVDGDGWGMQCYSMFDGCTALTSTPSLPATTLTEECYEEMFDGCTALTSIPANLLPATTLADWCYVNMFKNCTGLSTVPANLLPVTTLAEGCYQHMFRGCTSLLTAPDLPATTLALSCYYEMFSGCTKLSSINVAFTDWTDTATTSATLNWVSNVANNGTFTCPAGLDTTTRDASHIPANWTVVNPQ